MTSACRLGVMTLVCMLLWSAPLAAQSPSLSLVRQLTTLLEGAKLDTLAAKLPGTEDSFVAARYFPGQQLIVVSGRYAAPALLKEKIFLKRYGDAYLDLYTASDRASRRVVEVFEPMAFVPFSGRVNRSTSTRVAGVNRCRSMASGSGRSCPNNRTWTRSGTPKPSMATC